jgi:superfamily I DNA/RNA helicase
LKESQTRINREVRLSGDKDLTSRFPLHIATAEDVKGLQFNAVLIPGLECFASVEKHLYVAMTRAKDALYLASPIATKLGECVEKLKELGALYEEPTRPRLEKL